MFATIRRHQSWLYLVIAGITIASFIVFGPSSCSSIDRRTGGGVNLGSIGGRTVKREELEQAQREVLLRYFLTTQQWPTSKSDFNITREAYFRLFLIEKEKEYGVQIDENTLGEFAHRVIGNAPLDNFVDQILKPQGLGAEDFERFLRHEAGAQQIMQAAGVSGKLVTPQEAEMLYREEHQEVASLMIYFAASNYMKNVIVTNETLMQFYTNRMSVYREPARVQVNYVKFNVTNYFEAATKAITNLDTVVGENVKKYGTNLFGHTKTPEESRAAIKNEVIRTAAFSNVTKDAYQFANDLYNMQPRKVGNLEVLAKQKGLTVKTTEPFDRENGPTNFDVLLSFPHAAFELSTDNPSSGAVRSDDGVYVLEFKTNYPSQVPTFDTVKEKVTADYRYAMAAVLMQQAGMKYYTGLTNGLGTGSTFTKISAQFGLNTEALPPISLSTTTLPESLENMIGVNELRQLVFTTPVGSVSPLARTRYGAAMIYVEKKLPVDEAKMKIELPGFLAYMRQARQSDAFNQWFNAQMRADQPFAALITQVSQDSSVRKAPAQRK
jgi:SurA N-terminal domain